MAKTQREEWKTFKNVFDNASILNLEKMRGQHHFDELVSPIALGKEANVFTARKDGELLIAKIYRIENCNFNQMYRYIAPDPRFANLKMNRRIVIFAWVRREYRNLLIAREVIRVPTPIAVKDSILLMEFIGRGGVPAPKLKDSAPKDPKKFFEKVMQNVRSLYKVNLVHADLSSFNILNFEEEPVFIDFSQATTREHPQAKEFLARDIKNVAQYFRKLGLKIDEEAELKKIMA